MKQIGKSRRWIVILAALAGIGFTGAQYFGGYSRQRASAQTDVIPFDGRRAYQMLQSLCAIGPRVSGTPGMQKQQELLKAHFEKVGGNVKMQPFQARHPLTGNAVPMANMIITWHPDRSQRILLCAHYDTRPFPDNDPVPARRKGVFLGANDGASGTALLAEMAFHMPDLDSEYGVDFVLFDGEELVFQGGKNGDPYLLGSTYFAKTYAAEPPKHRYVAGVLFDMVADRELQIFQEANSLKFRDVRPIVMGIWRTAKRLGVREFISAPRHEVHDDHLPLNEIAKIPTCDIIDFDYGRGLQRTPKGSYWHTTMDTPDKCSADSLAKVGWVILTWLGDLR